MAMIRRKFLGTIGISLFTVSGCIGVGDSEPTVQGGGNGGNVEQTPMSATTTEISEETQRRTAVTTIQEERITNLDKPRFKQTLVESINDRRTTKLVYSGSLKQKLDAMADDLSRRMAANREVAHTIEGVTAEQRYEQYDMHCNFVNKENGYPVTEVQMEVIGGVSTRGHTTETLATSIVRRWFDDEDKRQKLTFENAKHVGVGITLLDDTAYVVVNLCA